MKKGIKRIAKDIAELEVKMQLDNSDKSTLNKIQKIMSTLSIEELFVLDELVQQILTKNNIKE